jgi:3-methyladenine DNA glycosylase AlkD
VATECALAETIESSLRAHGTPERASGAKRYLKSDLEFIGVATPIFRKLIVQALRTSPRLHRKSLLATVHALWARPVFELRAAAVELLMRHVRLLEERDIEVVETLLRESRTWALVDGLAPRVAGPLFERYPNVGDALDRWAGDDDFWIRRAALLALLVPLRRGGGDFERFARYADAMVDEKEFFIRKAIGWVLREVGKRRPGLVVDWLGPRVNRAAGLTVREAVRYLPPHAREALLGERRTGSGPSRRGDPGKAAGGARSLRSP